MGIGRFIRRVLKPNAQLRDPIASTLPCFDKPLLFHFTNSKFTEDVEIVVLIPISPTLGRQFINSAVYLAQKASESFRVCRVVIDSSGEPPPKDKSHPYRQAALAKIRQDMVDKHLGSADWVAWIDADIVDYPSNLLTELISRADGGIAAPLLIMDSQANTRPNNRDGFGCGRFFDVAGYVENLRWARFERPYFDQPGPVYSLDSVGGCYVVNAEIYRRGAKHEADAYSRDFVAQGLKWAAETVKRNQQGPANCFTEHFSVCQWAKQHGLPVRAFDDLTALHMIV